MGSNKLNDEEIDVLIKKELSNQTKNGGNRRGWNERIEKLRHTVVIAYIRKGYSKKQTIDALCDRWDICDTTAYNYYNAALEYLGELNTGEDIGKVKQKQTERIEGMLQLALERGNYTNAARAMDMLNKINGLYTENQNITVDGDIKFEFD